MNYVKFLQWFQFILTVIACIMTVLYLHYLPLISSFYTGFLNTILATLYSLTVAVFIYWQQQNHKYESLKSSMVSYLDYLRRYFEYEKTPLPLLHGIKLDSIGKINLPVFNRSIVMNMINSGFFNEHTSVLINLQNSLDFHYHIVDKYLERGDHEGLQEEFNSIKSHILNDIKELDNILKNS